MWVPAGPDKQALIAQYRTSLANKDCMHFRFGEGTCPFGTSCFYRHRNKACRRRPPAALTGPQDGSAHVPDAPRYRLNASGDLEVMRPTQLSDFLALRL